MAYDNADMHGIDGYTRTGGFFFFSLSTLQTDRENDAFILLSRDGLKRPALVALIDQQDTLLALYGH